MRAVVLAVAVLGCGSSTETAHQADAATPDDGVAQDTLTSTDVPRSPPPPSTRAADACDDEIAMLVPVSCTALGPVNTVRWQIDSFTTVRMPAAHVAQLSATACGVIMLARTACGPRIAAAMIDASSWNIWGDGARACVDRDGRNICITTVTEPTFKVRVYMGGGGCGKSGDFGGAIDGESVTVMPGGFDSSSGCR